MLPNLMQVSSADEKSPESIFAKLPLEIKYMAAAPSIDLYLAACQWMHWVFYEPSIYPINEVTEKMIIETLAKIQDLKFIKIFELMIKNGGVTPAMHNAIYFAAMNNNKPLTHWLYENVNRVCCHENCTLKYSALLGAVTSRDIEWIRYVFTYYNNEGCKQLVNDNFIHAWSAINLLDVIPYNWIVQNFEGKYFLGGYLLQYAIEHNNLPLLQLLTNFGIIDAGSRIDLMIRYQHLDLIKWVCDTIPITLSQRQIKNILYLTNGGNVELLDWFYERGMIQIPGTWLFLLACEVKNIPLLNWIVDHNIETCKYDPQLLLNEDAKMIMWLMENSLLDVESKKNNI